MEWIIDAGHEQVRTLWRDYFFETDAIIFMVDSADLERMEEAKQVSWLAPCIRLEWSGTMY